MQRQQHLAISVQQPIYPLSAFPQFCKAKVSCPIPPQLLPPQARAAGERFAKQLLDAHDGACPWRSAASAPSLLHFPPLPPEAARADFDARLESLRHVLALPPLAPSAVDTLASAGRPRLERLLEQGPEQQQQHATGNAADGTAMQQLVEGGVATSDTQAFAVRTRLLALCGWDLRPMTTGAALAAAAGSGASPMPAAAKAERLHVGPESAALHCALCGVRAGLWASFPQCQPKVLITPRGASSIVAANAAAGPAAGGVAAGGRESSLGGAVVVDFSTTIAGGSLKSAARAGNLATAPFGAASAAPAFDTQPSTAANYPATSPASGQQQQQQQDADHQQPFGLADTNLPVFGLAALRSSAAAESPAKKVAAAPTGPLKRKQKDYSWEAVSAEIDAATAAERKRARGGGGSEGEGGAAAAAGPADQLQAPAPAPEPSALPTVAQLAKYQGLKATSLDPLALHRPYCPWVHCPKPVAGGEAGEGGRCGWRWYLQQLVPASEEGGGSDEEAALAEESGNDGEGGRRWDPAGLLRTVLHQL